MAKRLVNIEIKIRERALAGASKEELDAWSIADDAGGCRKGYVPVLLVRSCGHEELVFVKYSGGDYAEAKRLALQLSTREQCLSCAFPAVFGEEARTWTTRLLGGIGAV